MNSLHMLQRMLEVKGTPYTAEQLQRLRRLSDEITVAMLFSLLSGQDIDTVLRQATEKRLEPALRDVLEMVDTAGFVSSREVRDAFRVQPSTASNRIAALARSGLIRYAFDYIPPRGGKRVYYCRAEREDDPDAVNQFVTDLATKEQ